MPETTQSTGTRSTLAEYLLGTVFDVARQNRKAIELKWNRNRSIRQADPSYAPNGFWKRDERKGKWKSDTFFAIGRQKITTAHSIAADALFKDGKLAAQAVLEDSGSDTEALMADPAMASFADNEVQWEQARLERQWKYGHAVREASMALDDSLTYGEFWLHVYADQETIERLVPVAPGVMLPTQEHRDMMVLEHVSPWEMYHDLENGYDIRTWDYCIREQQRSPAQLASMAQGDGFDALAVKRVLDSAPTAGKPSSGSSEQSTPPKVRNLQMRTQTLWVREFWARVPRSKADAYERGLAAQQVDGGKGEAEPHEIEPEAPEGEDGAKPWDTVRVWALVAENEVIAYQREPKRCMYYRGECEPNNDSPAGVGIADKMEHSTKVLNGMIRSYENNAKLIASLVLAVKRELLKSDPEDALGNDGGIINVDPDCDDARKAIQQVTFQSILAPLLDGIRLFLEFADMESNIPRAEQGQQANNPQTAFELQQRLERSGKYIGGIVKNIDSAIEWAVGIQTEFNQGNPNEAAGKGSFRVIATGFTSFQNQVVRLQKLLQTLGQILASPDMTRLHKITWLLREIYKAQDIDPDQILKSPSELEADGAEEAQAQQAELAIAMLKAEVAAAEAKARKDDASAQQILASIGQAQEKVNVERAKAVVDIEQRVKGGQREDSAVAQGVKPKGLPKTK